MGGIISGYDDGRCRVGEYHRTGPMLTQPAIVKFRQFGANFILVPPIAPDHLPLMIGLQAKYRLGHRKWQTDHFQPIQCHADVMRN